MPKKIQNTTKAHIISVPLPNHGATYTVISHQFVIDYAYQALANAGFGIVDEEYRCTADGQIAQGIYKLQFNNDPELSMMFAWTNSYNKQVKFKCVVGAYINSTGSVMISGDMGSWVRKHMGTADTETKATIDDYITNAHMYYNQLVADKVTMEGIMLNTRKQAQLLGVLFAEYGILTTEQASLIRDQMKRPSFTFENNDSLWAFYNYVTLALQQSHPRTWMEDQRVLHMFISSIANFQQCSAPAQVIEEENIAVEITVPMEDPLDSNYGQPENQTNLLVQIAEVEAEHQAHLEAMHEIAERMKEGDPETYNALAKLQQDFENQLVFGVKDISELPETPLMSAEVVVMDLSDPESMPEPLQDYVERTAVEDADHVIVEGEIWTTEDEPQKIATILDEVVHYEDPAGNTFEAPLVKSFTEELEEKMVEKVNEDAEVLESILWGTTPSLEPTPEDHVIFEAEQLEQEENPFAEEDNFELEKEADLEVIDTTPVPQTSQVFNLLTEEEQQESFNWDLDDSAEESTDDGPDFF